MAQPALPRFAPPRSFYADLKARTTAYFEQTNQTPTGGLAIWLKAVVLIGAFVFFYTHLVFFRPESNLLALLECLLLGGAIAAIGFNVMHDGAHGSFSNSKALNGFAAFTLNVMGGSSFMWNAKHNVVHHTYTNIDGHDDDIDIRPFMRMTPDQPKHLLHRYQHLYFWFLYCMLYISWIFVMDYQKYFAKKIGDMPYKPMTATDHVVFWGFKAFNLVLYVGLPICMVGFLPWLIGFITTTMFAGLGYDALRARPKVFVFPNFMQLVDHGLEVEFLPLAQRLNQFHGRLRRKAPGALFLILKHHVLHARLA
jgi:linoleoyl-CoA desaturase